METTSGRGLVLQFFEAAVTLEPIDISCSFGYQCIIGRVLALNFLPYLMLTSKSSSLEFRLCEYFDVKLLILFGETSTNSLEL